MIKDTLFNLIQGRAYLDLLWIFIVYIVNYMIILKLGSNFSGSDSTPRKLIISGIMLGTISLAAKPFLTEWMFGLIIGILMIGTLLFVFKQRVVRTWRTWVMKVCWSWVLLNIVVGVSSMILIQPLTLIFRNGFFTTTLGIIVGTVCEFIAPLIILIASRRK